MNRGPTVATIVVIRCKGLASISIFQTDTCSRVWVPSIDLLGIVTLLRSIADQVCVKPVSHLPTVQRLAVTTVSSMIIQRGRSYVL